MKRMVIPIACALALFALAPLFAAPAAKIFNVAIVTGFLGDNGFNDEAFAGAKKAIADLGVKVDNAQVNTADLAAVASAMRSYAEAQKYDLVMYIGSNSNDAVEDLAKDFPDQKFSIVDTTLSGQKNVSSVAAIDPEQAFLSGVISGIVTQGKHKAIFPMSNDANVLIYAGGMDSPTSRAGAAGFMAGARYVNPTVQIIYTIVGSYSNPVAAKEIALTGFKRGADIVTGNCGAGALGLLEAAKEQKAYFISTSPSTTDPNFSLCTSVKKTDVFVYQEIEALVKGTWKGGAVRKGIKDGACDVSFDRINIKYPKDILDIVSDVRKDVVAGKIVLPKDPRDLDEWTRTNQLKK
jgi:basic membrane protein A